MAAGTPLRPTWIDRRSDVEAGWSPGWFARLDSRASSPSSGALEGKREHAKVRIDHRNGGAAHRRSDHAFLWTRDPSETALRHSQANAALRKRWDMPWNIRFARTTTAAALAGDVYRFGAQMRGEPDLSRDNAYRDDEIKAISSQHFQAQKLPSSNR